MAVSLVLVAIVVAGIIVARLARVAVIPATVIPAAAVRATAVIPAATVVAAAALPARVLPATVRAAAVIIAATIRATTVIPAGAITILLATGPGVGAAGRNIEDLPGVDEIGVLQAVYFSDMIRMHIIEPADAKERFAAMHSMIGVALGIAGRNKSQL